MQNTGPYVASFTATILCLSLLACVAGSSDGSGNRESSVNNSTTSTTTTSDSLENYALFLPEAYDKNVNASWPLIISLHGAGGLIPQDNLIEVEAKRIAGFRFIVVAPNARGYGWSNDALERMYTDVTNRYRVNTDQVYLTGLSMGAYGGWLFAINNPHRFAALALISGGASAGNACTLKHLPIWFFHNRADYVVPVSESKKAAARINACGGQARLTIYDKRPLGLWEHNAWRATWTNPDLYDWFLTKTRVP